MKTYNFYINNTVQTKRFDARILSMLYNPLREYTRNHFHSHMELHCITEGSTVFKINFGEDIVLNAGEWLLIDSDVCHEEFIPLSCSGYCLGIDINRGKEAFFQQESNLSMPVIKGNHPEIIKLFEMIFQEMQEQQIGYDECCKALFDVLLIRLLQYNHVQNGNIAQKKEQRNEDMYHTIDVFFNRVFDDDGTKLSIEELASKLNVSQRHVNRILSERYGMTFSEKLMETRILYAKYLLKNTEYSVQKISEMCGITVQCLIKNFKQIYGITPAKYRKLNKRDTM